MADSRETLTRCAILTSDAGNQSHGPWHGCSKGSSDRQDATAPCPNNAECRGFCPAVAGPQHLRVGFLYMIPPLNRSRSEGGWHEEALARRRRTGSAARKPRNGGRLAGHSTTLRSSSFSASRDIQLVDGLLFGRQLGGRLDASLLHPRQLS